MKFKNIVLAVVLAGLTASCNLDETPYSVGENHILEEADGASVIITSIYGTFWDSGLATKAYFECIDMDHDHSAAPSWVMKGAGEGNITNHWSYNGTSDPFIAFYTMINRANYALETLPQFTKVEAKVINQYMGEAYFLRAYAYFHLVRMYGRVPLRLSSTDHGDKERASVENVYTQIISDLEEADKKMVDWGTSDKSWGHANKMAANILLARVYATMGSAALAGTVDITVDINKGTTSAKQKTFTTSAVAGFENIDAEKCYKKVVEICDIVIARKGQEFNLRGSFKDIWGKKNARNNEFVWGVAGGDPAQFKLEHLNYYYSAIPFWGRGWAGISEGAYNIYELDDERGEHGIFHYVKNSFTSTDKYICMPADQGRYPIGPDGQSSRVLASNKTFFITKWYWGEGTVDNPQPNLTSPGYGYVAQDIPMIRYVEPYLLRAEALNELNKPSEALDDLDIVRGRAKATLLSGTTSDKTQIRSFILRERGMEFVQEFNRKFDLLRWGLYLDVMNETAAVQIQGGSTISKVRLNRSLLYAVPLNEINNNKLFGTNNPGW